MNLFTERKSMWSTTRQSMPTLLCIVSPKARWGKKERKKKHKVLVQKNTDDVVCRDRAENLSTQYSAENLTTQYSAENISCSIETSTELKAGSRASVKTNYNGITLHPIK
ncbi:hypothetical protein CDAR_483071 [Caerostris darwini]|uniref:Uncharacterized protein n=1 Tax=Caerostris darwini TaxID=1538125 RepID=A0AAV4V4P7_9ARAC|nr:hypothetical protein CDAR_483071 [Caerostris darwini]